MSESVEYENIFRRKELHDMFSSGEVKPLDDLYLVEDAALTVGELMHKLDFYKGLKKKKIQDIANEMKTIENKIDFFKSIIVSTLQKYNEKSIKFPGSCFISSRNNKAKWVVNDDEEFISVLQEAKKEGEDVDDVLEIVTQYNIRKREASKLLETWESNGKLEKFLSKARDKSEVISKEPAKTTVSIQFLDKDDEQTENHDLDIPLKSGLEEFSDLDEV